MSSIHSSDLDLNSENDLIELSEDELDQIHGGFVWWLAVPAIASLVVSGLRVIQLATSQEVSPSPSKAESAISGGGSRIISPPPTGFPPMGVSSTDAMQSGWVRQTQAETRGRISL